MGCDPRERRATEERRQVDAERRLVIHERRPLATERREMVEVATAGVLHAEAFARLGGDVLVDDAAQFTLSLRLGQSLARPRHALGAEPSLDEPLTDPPLPVPGLAAAGVAPDEE